MKLIVIFEIKIYRKLPSYLTSSMGVQIKQWLLEDAPTQQTDHIATPVIGFVWLWPTGRNCL